MKQQNVWFVIVTYEPDMEAFWRLVAAVEGWSVVIVENGGEVGGIRGIRGIRVIPNEKNLGYGGGANVGMKAAFDAGVQWAVVVNQDVVLTKAGTAKFVNALEHSAPGIIGPEAGSLDPKRWTTTLASRPGLEAGSLDSRFRGNDEKKGGNDEKKGGNDEKKGGNDEKKGDYISGSLIAIHKEVWEATGGFYEPYFMYYEDVDLCIRAKKSGFRLRQVKVIGFVHGPGKNERWIPDQVGDDNKVQKEYYLARNHLLFVRRLAPISVKVHELLRLPKTLAEHYQRGNTGAITGIRDFALGRFTSLKAGP